MAKSNWDSPRPKRSKSVIIIWLAFALILAVAAGYYYVNRDNVNIMEGGARAGAMGVLILIILTVGTFLEGRSARRKK